MKSKTVYLIALAGVLSGCTGLQVNMDSADSRSKWPTDRREREAPSYISERDLNSCPMYVPPAARQLAPAPVAQLAAVRPNDHTAREAILLDYIETLRYHIKDVNADTTGQYMAYLQACTSRKQK